MAERKMQEAAFFLSTSYFAVSFLFSKQNLSFYHFLINSSMVKQLIILQFTVNIHLIFFIRSTNFTAIRFYRAHCGNNRIFCF